MGRLKELLDKQAKDALNEKEAKELEKLLAKADEAEDSSEDDDSEDDEEEKAINEAAKKMADEVQKRVSKEMKDMREIVDSLKDTYDDKADKEVRFIDDPRLGRKTVEELSEMKVVIDERVKKRPQEHYSI
jgi:citrate synthase